MDRSPALLVAIVEAVRRSSQKSAANGGPEVWKPATKVWSHITGERWHEMLPNRLRNRFRDYTKGMSSEAVSAWCASVDPEVYRETLAAVLKTGDVPDEPPPVVPGVNAEVPAPKKTKPTPQERLEGIQRAEERIMGNSEEIAEWEIAVAEAVSKQRIAERMADHFKKRAAFVKSALEMLKDIVVPMEPARWDPTTIPAVHIRREQDAVLILADIHWGDETKPDIMGALNAYNAEIAKQKVRRLLAGIRESLEMLREHGNVRRLKILGLGDWVTGTAIFPGQAHQIEFGKMRQALLGADEMANLYLECLELPGIEEVDAEHVPGNHGRGGKKGEDPFEDNWDLVLYEFMKRRLANQSRLKFEWHWSWWMKPRIRGWDFLCAHGDEVKGWAGIPNYGLRRWAARWREMLDSIGQRYDYGVIGHHHVEVEERDLIISGAWPGASFFSAKELQMGGPSTQMFYSVSEDYGITWRRRLPLDPPRRQPSTEQAS